MYYYGRSIQERAYIIDYKEIFNGMPRPAPHSINTPNGIIVVLAH